MSAVPISFEISVVQSGWAIMDVRAADASYRIDGFSYNTLAFEDFVRFGVDVVLNANSAEVIFDGEPAGWSLSFTRRWEPTRGAVVGAFQIDELDSVDQPNPSRDAARRRVLTVDADGDQLGAAVELAMSQIEAEMGVEPFEVAWGQAYPVRGLAALKAALAQSPRAHPVEVM